MSLQHLLLMMEPLFQNEDFGLQELRLLHLDAPIGITDKEMIAWRKTACLGRNRIPVPNCPRSHMEMVDARGEISVQRDDHPSLSWKVGDLLEAA